MFDPVIKFFSSVFQMIGTAIGKVILIILSPFIWVRNLYRSSGYILKGLIAALLLCIIIPYAWFIWNVLWIRNYDINYTSKFDFKQIEVQAGEEVTVSGENSSIRTCGRSSIADVASELIDFNVNQNSWVSASLMYKIGLFGIPWDSTPWMDNKASFQRGVHRAVDSTLIEMKDALGRSRGTSELNKNLNTALSNTQISAYNWYFGLNPIGPKQTAWSSYRNARKHLEIYNNNLEKCEALFDARADNLNVFLNRIASEIGSTAAKIQKRIEASNAGWFDVHADNQFMEAKGQLYGYLGILRATRVDFQDIVESRGLGKVWTEMDDQLLHAVDLEPLIVSNGGEDAFIMPSHLTTMGFYLLRARTKLTEMRDTLKN